MTTRWSEPSVEYARPPFRHRDIGPRTVLVWLALGSAAWALIILFALLLIGLI
jgi:hypothetical protein